jgi:predicted ribosomally synthesized peptide with nif11-like leader
MLSEKIRKFNEHIIKNPELQAKIKKINSPIDLINIAKSEGFDLTIEEFKELAQNAFQQWLNQLNEATRLFFVQIHSTTELHQKLQECNSKQDLINLAEKCGFSLTESDINLAIKIAYNIQGFSFERMFFENKNFSV